MKSVVKCRSKSRTRTRTRKIKGGSSSSGSSLLKELESKYSKTSLPSSASVENMLDELNPTSKGEKNSGLAVAGVGVVIGVILLAIFGKKLIK